MKKSSKAEAPHKSARELLIDDLTALRNDARAQVIRAGIQETEFDAPVKGIEEFTNEQLADLLVWQREFNATALKGVLEIWNLKEETWWTNMVTLFNQHKTREQKLLRAAQKKLRLAWRTRNPKVEEPTAESA
jgi:hypothetical protein